MKPENYKKILLTMLNGYILSVQHCCPGETEHQLLHRLVDTTNITGHNLFTNQDGNRHFIAHIPTAAGLVRVMTVFNDPQTGKLDLDVWRLDCPEFGEEIFMILYCVLSIAISITISELVSHTKTHQSQLAMVIKAKAAAANL